MVWQQRQREKGRKKFPTTVAGGGSSGKRAEGDHKTADDRRKGSLQKEDLHAAVCLFCGQGLASPDHEGLSELQGFGRSSGGRGIGGGMAP